MVPPCSCGWTSRKQTYQVGTQPRDGHFGACFVRTADGALCIYAARPKSRVWVASTDGTVKETHSFRKQIAGAPAVLVGAGAPTDTGQRELVSGRAMIVPVTMWYLFPHARRLPRCYSHHKS